jgi:hypothetical protein
MLPFTRSWELRRLEDTEDAADEDENNNDDSSDGKLMSIEHEVESALVEMFTMHQANGQDVTGHLSLVWLQFFRFYFVGFASVSLIVSVPYSRRSLFADDHARLHLFTVLTWSVLEYRYNTR